jgi:hypothetical protein
VSKTELAKKLHCSTRTVGKAIADLVRFELVAITRHTTEERGNGTNTYTLLEPPTTTPELPSDQDRIRSAKIARYHARAHAAVSKAIKNGRLPRPTTCTNCETSNTPIQAHHENYSRRLEVIWLCKSCLSAKHTKNKVTP